MQIQFQEFKNKFLKSFRGRGFVLGASPATDWIIVVCGFLLLTGFILIFTVSTFSAITTQESIETDPLRKNVIEAGLLERIESYYDEKHQTSVRLLEGQPSVVDPSK